MVLIQLVSVLSTAWYLATVQFAMTQVALCLISPASVSPRTLSTLLNMDTGLFPPLIPVLDRSYSLLSFCGNGLYVHVDTTFIHTLYRCQHQQTEAMR